MLRSAVLAAPGLLGCGRSPAEVVADAAPPSVAAPIVDSAVIAEVDAAPARHLVSASVASFARRSVLDQCVDYRVTGVLAADAGGDPEGKLVTTRR